MRSHPAEFLNGERRQVWAVRRDSGEPFFLADGEAEGLRAFTKTSLRCPHPDCDVQISTRGGTKRDHFFHVNRPPHETGRESEFHLASKAMLAAWLAPRLPVGATVREEETVKDPATHLLRRADVMVTGRSGRQVAYEVEYKSFAVEDWRAKQTDYDTKGIVCAWLIGHSRVRMATGPSYLVGLGETAVRVPELAAEVARAGHPLLVINPVTREVGTLFGDSYFESRFRGNGTTAWIAVDPLDACVFHPRYGIVTPSLQRILVEEEARQRRAKAERERAAREDAAFDAKRQRIEQLQAQDAARWEASTLRATLVERWGEVPAEIEMDTGTRWGVWAEPAHWHGVIYEELLHGKGPNDDFKWRDVFAALDRHNIKRHHEKKTTFKALITYLERLADWGLVTIHRDSQRRVLVFSPTGLDLMEARRINVEREEARLRALDEARKRQQVRKRPFSDRVAQATARRREQHAAGQTSEPVTEVERIKRLYRDR